MALTAATLALVFAVIFFGGFVKGLVGFGYAIASTAVLAVVVAPSTAVVIMILPMLGANVFLLGELDRSELSSCVARFWPYVGAALVGTGLGMLALGVVPKRVVTLGLGAFTLSYVAFKQPWAAVPGEERLRATCFRPGTLAKGALGFLSGLVFGATNIGVQVVAYLDSLELDRSTFVGVLAMILVGISALRVGMAAALGLYDAGSTVVFSAIGIVPGLAGVRAGGYARGHVPERAQLAGVLGLLVVIGVRLTLAGAGVV